MKTFVTVNTVLKIFVMDNTCSQSIVTAHYCMKTFDITNTVVKIFMDIVKHGMVQFWVF